MSKNCLVKPVPAVEGTVAYGVPRPDAPIDLPLDGNDGRPPAPGLMAASGATEPEVMRRYPSARALETRIAGRLGVDPARVLVTGGGDDALMRACAAVLTRGREMILPVPTFEMFGRFAALAGGRVRPIPWGGGAWPLAQVVRAVNARTAAIVVVSPNNPTGAVAGAVDLRRVAAAAPHALVIADLAYAEFARHDLTRAALALPNAVAVRSFSKAWGMGGMRVGYAAGPAVVIGWMRACGLPYPTSGPSLAAAGEWLARGRPAVAAFVKRVRYERRVLSAALSRLGARPYPSEANFVLARFDDAPGVWARLASQGVGVRRFPGGARWAGSAVPLDECLRITCPGNEREFRRLLGALSQAMRGGPRRGV